MTAWRRSLLIPLTLLAPLVGCVTDNPESTGPVVESAAAIVSEVSPGERPALNTAEGGLWMTMNRLEKKLSTSGRRYRDKALNDYVAKITCKLAPDHCRDIRVYISRVPAFNASMAPNGFMMVWTGLLLRARNEAQLATVLGHEIGHYLRRHSLQNFEATRDTADFMVFFSLALNIAIAPGVGDLASIAAIASLRGFSRDHEREADSVGLQLMANAGYDPREAAKIWRQLIRELKAKEGGYEHSLFFATHPHPEERIDTLDRMAEAIVKEKKAGLTKEMEYRRVVGPHRRIFLRDELHRTKFDETEELLSMLLEEGVSKGEIYFFTGEMHRLKGKKKDLEKALEAYENARGEEGAPREIYKSLGIVFRKLGSAEKSRKAFEEYLRRAPDAEDRLMIESMIRKIG